jgi:hypothetical protein
MLITPVEPQLTKAGIITLGDHVLIYDAKQLTPEIEDLTSQLDSILKQMWGQHLYRIKMTLSSNKVKQRVKYIIR